MIFGGWRKRLCGFGEDRRTKIVEYPVPARDTGELKRALLRRIARELGYPNLWKSHETHGISEIAIAEKRQNH